MEDSHVLVDSAAHELMVSELVMCLLLSSSLSVEDSGSKCRKGSLADVFTVINCCLCLLLNFFYYFFFDNVETLPLVGHSVVSFLLPAVELVACHDITIGSEKVILLNQLSLAALAQLGVFNHKSLDILVLGEHSAEELYLCQLVKCLAS